MSDSAILIVVLIIACCVPLWGPIVLGIAAMFVDIYKANKARRNHNYYPDYISLHREQCNCEHCMANLYKNIDRLEKELGISDV